MEKREKQLNQHFLLIERQKQTKKREKQLNKYILLLQRLTG